MPRILSRAAMLRICTRGCIFGRMNAYGMVDMNVLEYSKGVLANRPEDWLSLTTHRLDIYDEKAAKSQFLQELERLYEKNEYDTAALSALPTAYDYIRLGHPLSCLLEWALGHINALPAENVISFQSKSAPILAILRKNALANTSTRIVYVGELPGFFKVDVIRNVYAYSFELLQLENLDHLPAFDGSTLFISQEDSVSKTSLMPQIHFYVGLYAELGSIVLINGEGKADYIREIQHVRRRETIAMTPIHCLVALNSLVDGAPLSDEKNSRDLNEALVLKSIHEITGTHSKALVASSGLSMQYAIMMGLIHDAIEKHPGKAIKILVPPNCYGGTNDQARRAAACLNRVEVLDLAVDGGKDMVQSLEAILEQIAQEDAVPYIIAEIPTNPRVEVPDLVKLREVLLKERKTASGSLAIDPVFILDQTFCPNVHFLGGNEILSGLRALSYVSGSKFPSGGKCTAGYCVGNTKTDDLMRKIELHLQLCDNEATALQMEILAKQLPSMNQRIADAYANTREFVNFINASLPAAKINFVSEDLASKGFTPSVFSLDLPTRGNTHEESEAYKRRLNHKLITMMISSIPNESKYCVSYGQLKGCYWTIPATSTQGTTKEDDKDYIARVALSPDLDLELHKKVFLKFVQELG